MQTDSDRTGRARSPTGGRDFQYDTPGALGPVHVEMGAAERAARPSSVSPTGRPAGAFSYTPGLRADSPELAGAREALVHSENPRAAEAAAGGEPQPGPSRRGGSLTKFGTKRLSTGDSETPKAEAGAEKRAKVGGRPADAAVDLDSTLESDQVLRPPLVPAAGPGDPPPASKVDGCDPIVRTEAVKYGPGGVGGGAPASPPASAEPLVTTETRKYTASSVAESRLVQRAPAVRSSDLVDHDAALRRAIQEATDMNPDMTVEKIEIQQHTASSLR
ncbi:Protein 4.1 [Amphibalanus amphitrite]|uniref:Protein 4.1 n=2 Tax=Amphibalanus amphitrite TaxID=1232801 RepID=A0A6A4X9G5_AMPAM|nr:Protein 4.1 [Amphibalanus amphitrite]